MEAKMSDQAEKRDCHRCRHKASLVCGYFNSEHYCPAKAVNHSPEGMYIETDLFLRPGASVYLRVDHQTPNNGSSGVFKCEGHPTVALAEVKWCRELTDAGDFNYGVGLKYHQPAY